MFSGRLAAFAATATVASGCLAGCSSSSPSALAAQANAGLSPGQATFSIRDTPATHKSGYRSTAGKIQGKVDGLALVATGKGGGDINCGALGTSGSSASGTLGGASFTVKLKCDSSDSSQDTGTYTGEWGGHPVNITVTYGNAQSPTPTTTLTGTVGSQKVTATVARPHVFVFLYGNHPLTVTGSMTVSGKS